MFKDIRRKMSSSAGMTLTETLTALAVAGLMSTVLVAGMNTAVSIYRDATHLAESETVVETVLLAAADEFRFASNASTAGGYYVFDSRTFGKNAEMKCTDEGRLVVEVNDTEYKLVSDGVYDDLEITDFEITVNDRLVTIKLSIGYNGSTYASQDITVRMMNRE